MTDEAEPLDAALNDDAAHPAWCLCERCVDERLVQETAAPEQVAAMWDEYHLERLSAWAVLDTPTPRDTSQPHV